MKHSRFPKLLFSTFALGLTAILLMTCVTELSAETTKQKRERLKAQSGSTRKPHESGKSYFGIAYGKVRSATVTVNDRQYSVDDANRKWVAGGFVDARMANKAYLGAAFNALSADVFGRYTNSLYDVSVSPKLVLYESSKFRLRPGAAFGYGMIPAKYGAKELDVTTKRLFVEGDVLVNDRFGFMVDICMLWASGSNSQADASGHCLYGRIGLIFL